MHLQLTISLLVSNQLQTIRRCLDSLVPILMQIPSELIIVDTSENEQVRDLALQYTNQVIPFKWCNDFSKARNTGLLAAQGEWFMYIDDDEWLEDVSEIVNFFTSGEYLNYKSATYVVRNYTQWNGIDYIDAHLGRMVQRTPETIFTNAIHEYLSPYAKPTKVFSTYAHHYGYVKNIIDYKNDRNIPLLEKELQEHEPTVHVYIQLTQEYMSNNQFPEAEKYARKCLDLNAENKEKSWCVAYLPYLIRRQGDYERSLEVGKQMLRHSFCTEIAALRIYVDLIETCQTLRTYDKNIIIYAKAYHNGLIQLDARPEQWFIQSVGGLGEQQTKSVEHTVYLYGLRSAINMSDSDSALNFLQWLPWGTQEAEKYYYSICALAIDQASEDFLLNCFSKLDAEDPFIFLFKAKAALKKGELESSITFHTTALQNASFFVLKEAVLLAMQSQGKIPMNSLLGKINLEQWPFVSSYITEKADIDQLEEWIKIVKTYLRDFPIQSLSLLMILQERFLIEGILQIDDQELFQEIQKYCDWVYQYTSTVYHEHLQNAKYIDFMPQNYRFALQIQQVFQSLENGDYVTALHKLRQAIDIYQPLCGIIRRMLSIIKDEMNNPARSNSEFELLGSQVKGVIKELIKEGRKFEAIPLVEQISSLLPRDLEVLRLRQELWNHKGD